MKHAVALSSIAVLITCGLFLQAGAVTAEEDARSGSAQAVPKPPMAWLAPYAAEATDEDAFTTLRERLFRTASDAELIEGLAWLAHARTKEVRVAAARGLAEAYLLGDHLGADPVPGIRAFANDVDPFVRTCMLSALALHDSPLARELLFAHYAGTIPVPDGDAGAEIRAKVDQLLTRYATPDELTELRRKGAGAQRAWFDDAEDHPATGSSHRFETGEVMVGEAHRVALESAPGTFLWFRPVRTAYATGGGISSGDLVTLCWEGSSRGEMGGAAIYGGGISSVAGGGSAITHARYLGDGKVRYWIRISPSGRALKHHRRTAPPH